MSNAGPIVKTPSHSPPPCTLSVHCRILRIMKTIFIIITLPSGRTQFKLCNWYSVVCVLRPPRSRHGLPCVSDEGEIFFSVWIYTDTYRNFIWIFLLRVFLPAHYKKQIGFSTCPTHWIHSICTLNMNKVFFKNV